MDPAFLTNGVAAMLPLATIGSTEPNLFQLYELWLRFNLRVAVVPTLWLKLTGESLVANLLHSSESIFVSPHINIWNGRPCYEIRAHNEQFLRPSKKHRRTFCEILLNNDQSYFDAQ